MTKLKRINVEHERSGERAALQACLSNNSPRYHRGPRVTLRAHCGLLGLFLPTPYCRGHRKQPQLTHDFLRQRVVLILASNICGTQQRKTDSNTANNASAAMPRAFRQR